MHRTAFSMQAYCEAFSEGHSSWVPPVSGCAFLHGRVQLPEFHAEYFAKALLYMHPLGAPSGLSRS